METKNPNSGCGWIIGVMLVVAFLLIAAGLTGCAKVERDQLREPEPPAGMAEWCVTSPQAIEYREECAHVLALERAEDEKVARWMERAQPWFAGFLALVTLAGLVWYFTAFSRLAYLGYRGTQLCGGEKEFRTLLAQLDSDNEARLRGALSAAAFGMGRQDER